MKAKHAQKFAAEQAQGGQIVEASIAEENEEFDQEANNGECSDNEEEYSEEDEGDEASPHAQRQQDSAVFIPRQMMVGSVKKASNQVGGASNNTDIFHYSKLKRQAAKVILN